MKVDFVCVNWSGRCSSQDSLHPLPVPQVHMRTVTPHQMTLGCPPVLASVFV